jgi:hypothetical protein
MIAMPQDVADRRDLLSRNFRAQRAQVFRNAPACFRDDLDCPFKTAPKQPVTFEVMKGLALQNSFRIRDRVENVVQRRIRGGASSEHEERRSLDRVAQARMQTVTRSDVDFGCQVVLEEALDRREIDQREAPRRIVIQEQIDIAVRPCFVARARTEQIKRRRAARLYRGGAFLAGLWFHCASWCRSMPLGHDPQMARPSQFNVRLASGPSSEKVGIAMSNGSPPADTMP